MIPVSIVIITKNEADIISLCIQKARQITDDVVIIDNGSTDETLNIATVYDCRIRKEAWDGYGANKNKGVEAAKYDWILSVDADEIPDDELVKSLHRLEFDNPAIVYDIKFRSYFGKKPIRFGSWGRDHHIRIFNRRFVKWSETLVHETLILPDYTLIKKINGSLHHYSVKNIEEYYSKCSYYAKLSARQYFNNGKKANAIKLYFSPLFGFFKNYILYLGFLDGRQGWDIAKTILKSTKRKYLFLSQMQNRQDKTEAVKDNLAVEY